MCNDILMMMMMISDKIEEKTFLKVICRQICYEIRLSPRQCLFSTPVTEFSVSICSTPKFICSSDDGEPRLLITENDTSYKTN